VPTFSTGQPAVRTAGYGEVAVCEVVQALAEKRAEAAAVASAESAVAGLRSAVALGLPASAPILDGRARDRDRCPELPLRGTAIVGGEIHQDTHCPARGGQPGRCQRGEPLP
jgi:hypothetical protein